MYNENDKYTQMRRLMYHPVTRKIQEKAVSYVTDQAKDHFGKEYRFNANDGHELIKQIIQKFIMKYDKNFDKHTQKKHSSDIAMIDTWFVCKLDVGTFMYVATGDKIGNVEKRFLMSNQASSTDMYIYIFGKKMVKYTKELESLTHQIYCSDELAFFNIDCSNGYRNSESGESIDVIYNKLQPRSLDTLFFSDNEKEKITEHIDRFNDNEEFYKSKQLLFKTGILLHGQPGTGKSSLVKAIASHYGRSIANVNTSNLGKIDLNKLTQSINVDENRRYIVLLEDIDTLFLNREDENIDKDDQAIINKLLQFLDSNSSPTNVIFIATTNHIERLDQALLREGRFDLKVEVSPLTRETAVEFGASFGLDSNVMDQICKDIIKDKNLTGDNIRFNQSTLQTRILSKLTNKSKEQMIEMYGEMKE